MPRRRIPWLGVLFALLLTSSCGGAGADPTPERQDKNPPATTTTPPSTPDNVPRAIPQPTFTGASTGCKDITLYRASDDGTQWMGIEVDKALQGLTLNAPKQIDLGSTPDGVVVFVDVYDAAPPSSQYCSGASPTPSLSRTQWVAEAGTLTIELLPSGSSTSEYQASIHLEEAHFVGPERGVAIVVPNVTIDRVRVGWSP